MTKHLNHALRIQKGRTALLLDHPFLRLITLPLGWTWLRLTAFRVLLRLNPHAAGTARSSGRG
jgi:hypothetical protein